MGILDVFNNDAFGVIELTEAFNVKPNGYGRLQQLNLFPAKGVTTRVVGIERKNGVLNLLPSKPVGAPASKGSTGKRDFRHVEIPHIPHEDSILAGDVQGVRGFNTDGGLMPYQELVNDKLETMQGKHDITLEFLRWGALKGLVLDADGSTELLDLFDAFGVTEEVMNFELTTSGTIVETKVLNLKRYMEQNLFGDTLSGIHVFCSSGFFDALTTHPNVRESYKYYLSNQRLGEDYRTRFLYGGVTFEEHVGQAQTIDGDTRLFIPANEARVVPLGSQSMKTYFAPADFIETVNTVGIPRYAKQRVMDFDRGIEVHTQSNPLPICLRPQLLVRLTKS